ncbi:ChbG/HpnK family deacetylase [Mesorhizobium xinjiangense]|uniref:ChbG/HpnK family deacetylase n=1 Tax=Mesorhizobium xinjiangense TaxID=2678685 RepID=UPI002E25CD69
MRRIWLIADDYGLSPAVDDGILELLAAGMISGTGCMTVFSDWPDEARRLHDVAGTVAVGLHLTLTDQPSLTGRSTLAPDGTMPSLPRLLRGLLFGQIRTSDIARELDAQIGRFLEAMQRPPAFIDGHQHVHFLQPVRTWLRERAPDFAAKPWLRGAPAVGQSPLPGKTGFVRLLAAGFAGSATGSGYMVRGPLAGFYPWERPDKFAPTMRESLKRLPDGAVFMCHPGRTDAALRRRDKLIEARPVELDFLASQDFEALLSESGVALAGIDP